MGLLRVRVVERSPKKQKFRNAEAARQDRENREAEAKLLAAHGITKTKKRKAKFKDGQGQATAHLHNQLAFQASLGRMPLKTGSRPDPVAIKGVQVAQVKVQQYTGNKLRVGQMHKSNAVAEHVDNTEFAKEITSMRR